jgi:hypothetical protein
MRDPAEQHSAAETDRRPRNPFRLVAGFLATALAAGGIGYVLHDRLSAKRSFGFDCLSGVNEFSYSGDPDLPKATPEWKWKKGIIVTVANALAGHTVMVTALDAKGNEQKTSGLTLDEERNFRLPLGPDDLRLRIQFANSSCNATPFVFAESVAIDSEGFETTPEPSVWHRSNS